MSDSEEENFCFYGKALDPYDEDLFPKKRPITVEEQIATDSNGRRRFHGAFTGGFSAGFFNTVGSLEGWTPSEFKSSRDAKQKHLTQNPEDFMDDEDMGEFGFAPNTIRATKDYDTSKKRKRKVFSDGPIPGEPVLHTLLTTGNETVGYLLLKNIGIKEKIDTRDAFMSTSSNNRIYSCEIPKASEIPQSIKNKDYEIPDFYKEFLTKPKNDTFGLGYSGLDRSHVNLFKSSDLVVHEKDKKLSIRGQAFGVGAFENDDDDIYAKEDMSNYDFELSKEKAKNQIKTSGEIVFDSFTKAKTHSFVREIYPPPVIPKSFTGKHKVKKSRFEPMIVPETEKVERRNINSTYRAELLGEETSKTFTASKPVSLCSTLRTHEETVKTEPTSDDSSSNTPAQNKPKFDASDLWNDRFVSAVQEDEATNALAPVKKYESEHYSKEMRDAAKLKMFGPLTRISQDWQPCSLLCKRFNVPEPMTDQSNSSKTRTRTKNLIFEYQKHHDENVQLKPGLSLQTSSENEKAILIDEQKKESPPVEVKQEIEEENATSVTGISVSDVDTKSHESQTEENLKENEIVDITDRLNIEEKGDLFRAIFLSSSESEDEEEEDSVKNNDELKKKEDEDNQARELELKSNVLGEELVLPKIKPAKEGILSGLDFKNFHKFRKPVEGKEEVVEDKVEDSINIEDSNIYGPKLPQKKMAHDNSHNSSSSNVKGNFRDSSSDEWVEKDEVMKSKKKKHKNDKSHKKKHKHKKSKRKS